MTSEQILQQFGPRESMEYDVVVVGGGMAGLSTAIHLKQLAAAAAAPTWPNGPGAAWRGNWWPPVYCMPTRGSSARCN